MITTPLSFHEKASGQVINLVSKLYISFDKERYTPKLPDDFQEIEYIQSTGTQYIDSCFKPDGNTEFDIKFNTENVIGSGSQDFGSIFGCRTNHKTAGFQLTTYNDTNLQGHFLYGTDANVANIRYNAGIVPRTDMSISFRDGELVSNGTTMANIAKQTFYSGKSLAIFGSYESSYYELSKTKLYSLKLYNNDTNVRNFVPAKAKRDSRNLLERPIGTNFVSRSLTSTHLADKIVISGTADADWADNYSRITLANPIPAGTYTFSIAEPVSFNITLRTYVSGGSYTNRNISPNTTSITFTTTEPITQIYTYIWLTSSTGTVYNNYEIPEPMLVAGNTTQDYEPYFVVGTAGLYDMAESKFYINSGTGTFTAGQPVEGIRSADYFTLDRSVLNGADRLDSNDTNPIQLWDTYTYNDFSDRISSVSIERSIEFPYGTQCAMADVTLNNFDRYFDPANGISPIAQYNLPNRPIKIYAGYVGETVIPQFVGMTQEMPSMNKTTGLVSYHAVDFLSEIAKQTLNNTISMRNVRTDEVLSEIVEQFGVLPSQYNFEHATNVIPFVFFDKGQNAGDAIKKLVQAEGGKFWLDEMGILRFEKRSSQSTETVMTIPEYSIISCETSDISDVVNRVKISCDLREVQEFQTVYSKNSTGDSTSNLWVVGAGQSIVRECRLEDPCYDIVSPTLGKNTGVSWFTAKNSTQQEISSGITAVGELSTNAYTITFTNSNLFPVEIDEVQLWGEPAKVYDVLEYDAYDDESVEKYGERILEITDNEFFQSFNQAQNFATYLLSDRANYNQTLNLQIKGDFSLQLSDAIEVEGEYAGEYRIDTINWQLENGNFVYSIKAHKYIPISYFTLDKSKLDGGDILA